MGLVRALDGNHLYVSTGRGGSIAEIDLTAKKVVRSFAAVGARPWGISLSYDGKRLYTANGPSNDLTILDLESGQLRHVPIGGSPWGVVSTLQR
jgi:YVTN family beta-propeller protein